MKFKKRQRFPLKTAVVFRDKMGGSDLIIRKIKGVDHLDRMGIERGFGRDTDNASRYSLFLQRYRNRLPDTKHFIGVIY